jgi:RNA polymerase sigma-70 factor (ECF subfamily)
MTMSLSAEAPNAPLGVEDALERLSRVAQSWRRRRAAGARKEGLTPQEGGDCIQDSLCTLLELFQSGEVDPASDPAPVLVTVVRNAARNQRRRHYRSRPHSEVGAHELADRGIALPEELLSRAEDAVRLRACVASLCEIQRAVVTLRFLEERPGEDVAELLGVSKNHVAVLLHRAKAALRDCLSTPA